VLGISCITNPAAGVSEHALTHEEVTETAKKSRARFTHLIRELIRDVPL
jgi:purine-nucleoside phosphorylase